MTLKELEGNLANCRLLVFDFDGVFTDNKVYINDKGEETVRCDRSDTHGLKELQAAGVEVFILSTEVNKVVQHRANKLGLECLNGQEDKGQALEAEMEKRGLKAEQVVYIGNDVNDLPCFEIAGVSIAVANSYPPVKEMASYVTTHSGGDGAVREVIELVLAAQRVPVR